MVDTFKLFALAYKIAPLLMGKRLTIPTQGQGNPTLTLTEKDIALLAVKKKTGSVTDIIGSRDTGKTVLAYRLAEFFGRPTFAVSPQQVPPSWITRIRLEEVETRIPAMSTLICDDLPAYFSNRDYNEELSRVLERIIPMVRHKKQPPEFPVGEVHLIFCTQSAAQADRYILDCDLAFFKPLGLLMEGIERPHIGRMYRDFVNPCFDNKDDEFIKRHVYMLSRGFRGLITVNKTD